MLVATNLLLCHFGDWLFLVLFVAFLVLFFVFVLLPFVLDLVSVCPTILVVLFLFL